MVKFTYFDCFLDSLWRTGIFSTIQVWEKHGVDQRRFALTTLTCEQINTCIIKLYNIFIQFYALFCGSWAGCCTEGNVTMESKETMWRLCYNQFKPHIKPHIEIYSLYLIDIGWSSFGKFNYRWNFPSRALQI